MGKNNGKHSAQRSPDWVEHCGSLWHMLSHFSHLFRSQAGRVVQKFPASLEFAHVMEQRRSPDIVDMLLIKPHAHGQSRGIECHSIGVVVRVLVVRYELLQNRQETEISLAEFNHMALFSLIKSPHRVGCDQQQASPRDKFGPPVELQHARNRPGKETNIRQYEYQHHEDTR